MGQFASGVGDEEIDAPRVGFKPYPKGAFGPGPMGPSWDGRLWVFAYLAAVVVGGLLIPFWVFLDLLRSGQEESTALLGFAFVLILIGTAGSIGGLIGVALLHLTVVTVQAGSRWLSGSGGRTRK